MYIYIYIYIYRHIYIYVNVLYHMLLMSSRIGWFLLAFDEAKVFKSEWANCTIHFPFSASGIVLRSMGYAGSCS